MSTEHLLVALGFVIVLGVSAQWLAWRLRVPSILLLLGFGFLAGPGFDLVDPEALFGDLLLPIVSFSVALILLEGGMSLRFAELRGSGGAIWSLVSAGALVTWGLTTLAALALLPMRLSTATLLGAILVVTGPTVVQPLLRHVRPVGRAGAVAKWEGIVIDPIGAALAVFVFEAFQAVQSTGLASGAQEAALGLLRTALLGIGLGGGCALLLVQLLKRYWIPDFLQSPVLLMLGIAAYTSSDVLQKESGLLAVTAMGVALANQHTVSVKHLIEFKENLRVLLISTIFILLAARVEASELARVGWRGVVFVAVLLLVVRPIAVALSTLGSPLTRAERLFLAWLAPRGIVAAAVSSVFALRLGEEGRGLVPVTFIVIIGTVAVYGLTAPWLARRLGLSNPNPQGVMFGSAHPGARAIAHAVKSAGFPVLMVDNNRAHIHAARLEGLPTQFTSILSEQAFEGIEQGGLGRLLAMTSNDEVNAIAAVHFREHFGRAEVFQLPPGKEGSPRVESAPTHLRGRLLFAPHASYDWLDRRFADGAIVKTTRLTKEFDYEAFRANYGEQALPLFLILETGGLVVVTADGTPAPRPGQTLISLVDAGPEPAKAEEPDAGAA